MEKVTVFLNGQVCTGWLKKEVYALLKEEWIKSWSGWTSICLPLINLPFFNTGLLSVGFLPCFFLHFLSTLMLLFHFNFLCVSCLNVFLICFVILVCEITVLDGPKREFSPGDWVCVVCETKRSFVHFLLLIQLQGVCVCESMLLDTQGQGEHAQSTRKGPNLNLNPEPSCLEVPVRTTAPPCHKTERQCWFIFFILGWLRSPFYCDFACSSYVCLVEFRIQISHRSEWLWFARFPDCSSSSPPSTLNWISGQ